MGAGADPDADDENPWELFRHYDELYFRGALADAGFSVERAAPRTKTITHGPAFRDWMDAINTSSVDDYAVGDSVFVKLQPYVQMTVVRRSNYKLSFRYYGPYKIIRVINPVAYELELPAGAKMTVTPQITVSDGRLEVRGRTVLSGVPDNITAAHAAGAGLVDGAFVGATAGEAKSHHVFTFGTLRDCRFMCLFRFKLWWMTQRMGTSGRDVPLETQFILIEVPAAAGNDDGDSEPVYLVMLPLLEGQFRTVLQGNDQDQLQICIESGDKAVQTEQGMNSLYIHAGTNPFDTITQAVKAVEKHMQTFHHREKKKLPSFVDWFGWCTWDAFYTDVTADGVKQGLRSLAEGGVPPRFLIIDDGWQQIGSENKEDPGVAVQEGAQFASRLTGIKENTKFQSEHDQDDTPGLKRLVEETKKGHGVKSVYVWHAMAGYWGGVKPSAAGMEHYESALAYPVQSPGVTGNQPDIVMDSLSVLGLGLVHPRKVYNFYDELHAYLAACGVDGVKLPGRPTRDCLFSDPARDGASLLKIWNMNKCAGVVGVFNCQGAGWCRIVKKTRIHDEAPGTLTGSVRAEDVEGIAQAAGTDDCTGDAVVYAYRAGELVRLPRGATLPVTLKRLEYELFHVCPIRTVAPDVSFAPIGLLHMFNAGGAVEECTVRPDEDDKAVVSLRVRGCGLFGAYCSRRPVKCSLDSGDVGFGYDADTGLVTVDVPVPEKEMYRWALEIRV
ncbi:putative galactinol--sucrose galactosyltransferase 2 [Triticum urartu]|uniref:galactinol--sucrose galactosyltransferase n=1 Tax=Triticum urartu TaxID=4572 RepID=M7ZY08_TRIUA|nr:putative galactinol--sucrose galactosyltransferase 2 [Triticum urartu]